MKNKQQSSKDSQQSIVQSHNEVKTTLSQISKMLNRVTLAWNAEFSLLGTNDKGERKETTNDEDRVMSG